MSFSNVSANEGGALAIAPSLIRLLDISKHAPTPPGGLILPIKFNFDYGTATADDIDFTQTFGGNAGPTLFIGSDRTVRLEMNSIVTRDDDLAEGAETFTIDFDAEHPDWPVRFASGNTPSDLPVFYIRASDND